GNNPYTLCTIFLGNGIQISLNFKCAIQDKPRSITDAFIVGEDFIEKDKLALILVDNIFYGQEFIGKVRRTVNRDEGATIFVYYVNDPTRLE
ncbi:unnamed protein product, partial [marine sediment metagenome]